MITVPNQVTYDLADMLERIESLERSNLILLIAFFVVAGVLLAFIFADFAFGSRR